MSYTYALKQKEINELLKVLKEEFNKAHFHGLCVVIEFGECFSLIEQNILLKYLRKHAPWNKHTFLHKITFDNPLSAYMWESGDSDIRNKWLDKHIKKTQVHEK
tara:strand:+ start:15342 stop:15653 length:312 start_codon:yes stop_codon:yes gene_type:complete